MLKKIILFLLVLGMVAMGLILFCEGDRMMKQGDELIKTGQELIKRGY